MSEFVRKLSDGEYDEYELPVRRWLLSYALISLLGCVHQCSNSVTVNETREFKWTGYTKLRKMVDSGLVIWNSAIELCGYNHQIDGAQASNALNWLYTYRNGVAHCGVNHARYCLQVLEGDKETEKIVQIILVYMFILINTCVEAYSAEEQEDYAVCFAELVEVLHA